MAPNDPTLTSDQATELKSLRRKRGLIIRQLTTFTKTLDTYLASSERDSDYLHVCFEHVSTHWNQFNDIQSDIEELDPKEEARRDEIEETYLKLSAQVRKALRSARNNTLTATPASPAPTSTTSTIAVKLPQIQLPSFDGSYEDWTSFYDLFTSLIDGNDDLTPVQKFQYLRSAVKGKAAKTIQCLSTTDANYIAALKILKDEYGCTRKIIRRHWSMLREIPRLTKDTPTEIGDLVDSIRQHVRALENLGQPVSSWDTPIIDLFLTKISAETSWYWELTLPDQKMPSYSNLLEFLEKRASCSDTAKSTASDGQKSLSSTRGTQATLRSTRGEPKQAYLTNAVVQCPICKEAHSIYKCKTFLAMPIEGRKQAVQRASLCVNCLSRTHGTKDCNSVDCRICQKRHHTMLHQSNGADPEAQPSTSKAGVREETRQQA